MIKQINRKELNFKIGNKDREYGFAVKYVDYRTKKEVDIQYLITINLTEKEDTKEDNKYATINRKRLSINKQSLENTSKELAFELGMIIYPLTISLTKDNKIAEIINRKEIANSWEDRKIELKKNYLTDVLADKLGKMDKILNDSEILKNQIEESLFFSLYFFPLYGEYIDNYKKVTHKILIESEASVKDFDCQIYWQPQLTKAGKYLLNIEGICRQKDKVINLKMDYNLNDDFSLFTAKGAIEVNQNDYLLSSINIDIQEFEQGREFFNEKITGKINKKTGHKSQKKHKTSLLSTMKNFLESIK